MVASVSPRSVSDVGFLCVFELDQEVEVVCEDLHLVEVDQTRVLGAVEGDWEPGCHQWETLEVQVGRGPCLFCLGCGGGDGRDEFV